MAFICIYYAEVVATLHPSLLFFGLCTCQSWRNPSLASLVFLTSSQGLTLSWGNLMIVVKSLGALLYFL